MLMLLFIIPFLVGSAGPFPTKTTPPNIVVISLDTVRADRLTPYGFMDAPMPAFERIAAEGVVFDRALTVAPLTLPAHTSLFTGLYPPAHGVHDNADPPLPTAHVTLAERLRPLGFRTGAFVGSVVLAGDRGLAQGFDVYGDVRPAATRQTIAPQRRADAVIDDALAWIDAGPAAAPFFLWAHLYDAHLPYDPPAPFNSRHADPYVGEIAFIDAQIGRLLAEFDRRRLTDRTLLIVVADHGEALGDHGEPDHGIFVYDGVVRVPLMIRAPGVAPERVRSLVRLIDIAPTVMAMIGVSEAVGDGVSLLSRMQGADPADDLDAYVESLYPRRFGWSELRALTDGRYKLIQAPRAELYDLSADPFEERNLLDARPQLAAAMARRLTTLSSAAPGAHLRRRAAGDESAPHTPSEELTERLSALGYVAGTSAVATGNEDARPDPKDCIAAYAKLGRLAGRGPVPCVSGAGSPRR